MRKLKLPIILSAFLGFALSSCLSLSETISFMTARNNYSVGQIINELPISDFELSPDGKQVITSGPISTPLSLKHGVKVWNVSTRESTRILAQSESEINDIVFLKNGSKIATAHENGAINIWDFQSGKNEKSYSFPNGPVGSITVNSDKYLIAGSHNESSLKDEQIYIWDLSSSKPSPCSIKIDGLRFNLAPNPVNATITGYSIVGGLRSIDLKTCAVVKSYEIDIWNLEGPKYDSGSFITFLEDGKTFISNVDNKIEIWDVQKPKPVDSLEGHKSGVLAAAVYPNNRAIISGSRDNTIRLWDLQSKNTLKTISVPSQYLEKLMITPDGETLLTWGEDNSIQFWDIKSVNIS